MAIELDLRVEALIWYDEVANLEEVCQIALNSVGADGHVDVLLTDNATMQGLNRNWRGKDQPTDVLSFPADQSVYPFLGDIAIGAGIALKEAVAGRKTPVAHLSHLLIHGLLHLLGYDHEQDEDAERMQAKECEALARLSIADPYSISPIV